jgi:glyoxylase-like metal-dependent hydrolase (beta-lactamase superfamily II)
VAGVPDREEGTLEQLAPGVYVWLQLPGRPGRANAGVVVDEDGLTLVDSLMVPSQWMAFAAALSALGRPVRRIVLTSSHVDYAGGTVGFRLAAVFGRPQTSAHLDQPANPAILRRLLPEFADELDDDFVTRPVSHVVDAPVQLTSAIAVFPFAGEQAENLLAVVSGAGVVFAGAMCSFGVTPQAYQGDPAAWAAALDEIADLGDLIVPGHGPVGGEAEVRLLQAYLRACVDAEGNPERLEVGPWHDWPGGEHHVLNVERAAMLARGRDEIPPTLLERLGLA